MPRKTFGERMKAAMKPKDIGQRELARRVTKHLRLAKPLSHAAVAKWVNSTAVVATIEAHHLFAVADITDTSARWLATGEGTPAKWVNLSHEEKHLVELYRGLPEDLRARLITIAVALPPASPGPSHTRPFVVPLPSNRG